MKVNHGHILIHKKTKQNKKEWIHPDNESFLLGLSADTAQSEISFSRDCKGE